MRWLLLAVLVLSGSCAQQPRLRAAQVAPDRPAALLRKLALDVPADLARLPLVAPGEEAATRIAAAPSFLETAQTSTDAERARECLTTAIYYEARSEPLDGQRAVAQVVLNRVRDRAFPASVCGVVFQGSNRRTGCQFSFTCDGSMNRPRDPDAWARSALVADAALAGDVYAPVGSATHFHTSAISPWWAPSLTKLTTVGAHVFYRWPLAMERALTFRQRYAGYEPEPGDGGGVSPGEVIAAFGTESAFGVTIHRGTTAELHEEAAVASESAVARPVAARVTMMSGVRVHSGVAFTADEGSGVRVHRAALPQASSNPTPIEARAASASLDTTG